MDKNIKAKKKFIEAFFKSFENRWENLNKIYKQYPGEGLVLAYCFTEALGFYRYKDSKLSSTEQFIKILLDYQSNKHFFVIPPRVIEELPSDRKRRTIGRDIKLSILEWLERDYSGKIGLKVDFVWSKIPKKVIDKLTNTEKKKIGHLYQICWAGLYYHSTRTAGIHKAYFPLQDSETNKEWEEISRAITEILEKLKHECLSKVKWPHELPQPEKIF